jgi:hypothetical protein
MVGTLNQNQFAKLKEKICQFEKGITQKDVIDFIVANY